MWAQRIFRRGVAAVAALLAVVSLHAASVSDSADRAALEAAAQAYVAALNAREVDALADLATSDIVLIDASVRQDSSSQSVSGREAARQWWKRSLAAAVGRVVSTAKEITIAGDIAWRIASITRELPGSSIASRTQSLEIWKRVNGQWKLHRLMSAGMLAGPSMLPRPPPPEPVLDKTPR